MRAIITASLMGLLLTAFAVSGQAQTQVDSTTFQVALTATATTVDLTAAAGSADNDYLYVEGELMQITGNAGDTDATTWTVRRGMAAGATPARAHSTSALVWVGDGEEFDTFNVAGTCTQSNELYHPHFNTQENRIFDCSGGHWVEWEHPGYARNRLIMDRVRVRDEFNQGYLIFEGDATPKVLTDATTNIVLGSPLGVITYFEEQAKTVASFVTIDGVLDISADDTTDNEGVEIVIGNVTDPTLHQTLEAGTNGGCISALIDIADISGTDQVQIGWRQNEAFDAAAAYTGYTVWNTVGVNATDGSIVSSQEVSEATDTDDSGVNWADGEERALKVCIDSGGVPTAFYSDASPNVDSPIYNAIPMTNTGGTLTAGTGMVPFISYIAAGTDGADVTILWVELEVDQ